MFRRKKPPFEESGIRHATVNGHRLHLRPNAQGNHGFLWIDGKQPPLILDLTATEFVAHTIEAMWKFQHGQALDRSSLVSDYVVETMYKRHGGLLQIGKKRVTRKKIRADLDRLFGTIMNIAAGMCPCEVTDGPKVINYAEWTAPARMDLALTYCCNLQCTKCYAAGKHTKEMNTNEWKRVLDRLWNLGISQVVFTGGEPKLRPDLVELISAADKFVTGLITNGTMLAELAIALRDASLDYVQVTIESYDPTVHDALTQVSGSHEQTVNGIMSALKAGLQVVTNTTLSRSNVSGFLQTIRFLHSIGIKNMACNSFICSGRGSACKTQNGLSDDELKRVLSEAVKLAGELGVDLQWYTPTCYTQLNPMDLGFGIKACSAAAHNMTIEPDGRVLPCQSWPESVGSINTDKWYDIWNHQTCVRLRNHHLKAGACADCKFVETCGGGCSLDKTTRTPAIEGGDA